LAAFTATQTWIYPTNASANLIEVTSSSIPTAGTYVRTRGTYDISFYDGGVPRTISEVVGQINSTTDRTGFSIDTTSREYAGYKNLNAEYIVPVPTLTSFSTGEPVYADFRTTPAMFVLNMSYTATKIEGEYRGAEEASLNISDNTFTCSKETRIIKYPSFSSNSYVYSNLGNKDIRGFVNTAMSLAGTLENPEPNFSYGSGILKMDVALFSIPGVPYGTLRNRSKASGLPEDSASTVNEIELDTNDPETGGNHVYLGMLGDVRFYQISDYNLYRQYVLIKRRLGLPWDGQGDDYYVSNDLYKFEDFFHCLHENDQFLTWLKFTRFAQITDSIQFERLVQNEYLWLFLKLHKELGCDQRVQYLTKKTEEDEEKAEQLR
jgi:hypothetical protein